LYFKDFQSNLNETFVDISEKIENASLLQKSNEEIEDEILLFYADFEAKKRQVFYQISIKSIIN